MLVASKGSGLEANLEKPKYVFMFLEQDVGRNRNTKKGNRSFESIDKFKYLKKNTNCLHEKLNSRLNSGNVYYHLVQNLLS